MFLASFVIKSAVSFLMHGPFLFSDEACVILKASYLAEHLKLMPCNLISDAGAGDPFPLYSILISPIYYFLGKGFPAYYAVLILNSFLISSLVFPLYSIYEKFLNNWKYSISYSFLTIFLSEIVIFEKMLMTECLFIIINIWFLHFYINSFSTGKIKNKLISIFFAILGTMTRPFGFILILSLAVNEFIISKKKKKIILLIGLSILITLASLYALDPGIGGFIYNRLVSTLNWRNVSLLSESFISQLNSFTLASLTTPLLIFIMHIYEKDFVLLNRIRYFLLSFIALSFAISMQHLYGYLLDGIPLDLMTRYINVALIYIFIFFLIFTKRYKKIKIGYQNAIIIAAVILPLLFIKLTHIKFSQNLDLYAFLGLSNSVGDYTQSAVSSSFSGLNFFLIMTILVIVVNFLLLFLNKRKLILIIFSIFVFLNSAASIKWMDEYVKDDYPPTFELLKNSKYEILFIQKPGTSELSTSFWRQLSLTPHESYAINYYPAPVPKPRIPFPLTISKNLTINVPDVIVTYFDLDYLQIGPPFISLHLYAPKLTIRNEKKL